MCFQAAAKYYKLAAEQGHPFAQTNLGVCYRNGWGVQQSDSQAVHWYEKAAEQGYATLCATSDLEM